MYAAAIPVLIEIPSSRTHRTDGTALSRSNPDDHRLANKDSRLETAKGCHKVVDLAGRRRLPGFEVALNAQSGEEGEHHLGNCRSSHLGLFGLDVHRKKALQ